MQQVIWPSWTFEKAFGHSEWHSGEKLYNCEQCGDAGDLKRHLVTHSGEKPHKCAQCKHSTTQASALKTHIMTHTGVKPHQCGQCGYSSNKLPNMRQHKKVHSGEKPHTCSQCDFSQLAIWRYTRETYILEKSYTSVTNAPTVLVHQVKCKVTKYPTLRRRLSCAMIATKHLNIRRVWQNMVSNTLLQTRLPFVRLFYKVTKQNVRKYCWLLKSAKTPVVT